MEKLSILFIKSPSLAVRVGTTHADEYGFKVLPFLSNPAGPTAEVECWPPIEHMLREQRSRHPPAFPNCEEANDAAYVQLGSSSYDPCHGATAARLAGATALWGRRGTEATPQPVDVGAVVFTGQDVTIPGVTSFSEKKVCERRHLGKVILVSGVADTSSSVAVDAYDFIAMLDPMQGAISYVDVIVDGKRYRRTRLWS